MNHGIPSVQQYYEPWDPIGTATLCTLIDTNLCKRYDGQARPKHVADVTSCRIQLSIVLCKDGLIQYKFVICAQRDGCSPIQETFVFFFCLVIIVGSVP